MKDDPEDVPMAYLLYVILGTLLLVAGAVFFINRMSSVASHHRSGKQEPPPVKSASFVSGCKAFIGYCILI